MEREGELVSSLLPFPCGPSASTWDPPARNFCLCAHPGAAGSRYVVPASVDIGGEGSAPSSSLPQIPNFVCIYLIDSILAFKSNN